MKRSNKILLIVAISSIGALGLIFVIPERQAWMPATQEWISEAQACIPKAQKSLDRPEFSEEEVVAIVKRVILSKRPEYLETSLVDFSGTYTGEGRWVGEGTLTSEYQIDWRFYEKSQTVEFLTDLPLFSKKEEASKMEKWREYYESLVPK